MSSKRKRETKTTTKTTVKRQRTNGIRRRTKNSTAKFFTNINPNRGPIAQRLITKLKYNEGFGSAATPIDYVWNLNSIFDPNQTGTGHQPYGHDTLALLYNRYRVIKTSFILRAASGTAGTYTARVVVGANNAVTAYTDANLAAESPNFRTFFVQNGTNNLHIKGSYYLPQLTGQTETEYKGDDRFAALFGASPTENLCLHVVNAGPGDNTSPGTDIIVYNITLIFHVECWDPKELSGS